MSVWRDIGAGAVYALGDLAAHHPHDNQITVNGVSLLVREIVHDAWGHSIELVVVGSPEGKLNGYSTGTYHGSHARDARDECLGVLGYQVSQIYG